jgi:hypothetical protein
MKFLTSILLTALLAYAFGLYLPWWSIAIAAFAIAILIRQKPLWAFLSGFIALLLLWGLMSLIMSSNNNHILAGRMAMVILKSASPLMLILLTAMIGALIGGLAALSGNLVRRLLPVDPS